MVSGFKTGQVKMAEKGSDKKKQVSKTLPKNPKPKSSRSTKSPSLGSLLSQHPTLGVLLDDLCR